MYIHASNNAYPKCVEKMFIFVLNIGAFKERRYGVNMKIRFFNRSDGAAGGVGMNMMSTPTIPDPPPLPVPIPVQFSPTTN